MSVSDKEKRLLMDAMFRVQNPHLTHQGAIYLRKLGPHAKKLEPKFETFPEDECTTAYWPVVEVTNCSGTPADGPDSPPMYSVDFSTGISNWTAPAAKEYEVGEKCVLVFLPNAEASSGSACWVVQWPEFLGMAGIVTADAPEDTFDQTSLADQLEEVFPVGENTYKLISAFYDNRQTKEIAQ